jgi:hypothetical protein
MRTILSYAMILLLTEYAGATFFYETGAPFRASYEQPATFTFGFERAGMEVSLDVVVPNDVPRGGQLDMHITAENASMFGFDWDTFSMIAGSPDNAVNYLGYWSVDRQLIIAGVDPVQPDHKFYHGGATARNHFPAYFDLRFRPGDLAGDSLSIRMAVEDVRGIPEPATLLMQVIGMIVVGCNRIRPQFGPTR